MTLAATLLPKLNDWRPTGDGRHTCKLSLPEQEWVVGIAADKVDTVGCLLWELTLNRNTDGSVNQPSALRQWAERIAATTTGLLEPLRVYEIDTAANIAILRSDKPSTTDQRLAYYEVVLEGLHRATLRRYQTNRVNGTGSAFEQRLQMNFTLTHEGLCRVAETLAGE